MEFRWVALIALWTLLSGPIFGAPDGSSSRTKNGANAAAPAKAIRR
jgi:hypothetical protein